MLFSGVAVAALFVLRQREPDAAAAVQAWGYPVAPAIFTLASLAIVANALWTDLVTPMLAGTPWGPSAAGLADHRRRASRSIWWMSDAARGRGAGSSSSPRSATVLQLALVGDRAIRQDADLEHQRLVAVGADLDAVRARLDVQPLEHAVEVVDRAREVAVDVDRRVARLDLQPQRAVVAPSRSRTPP